ncbi:MAG TPA: YihY/virulence factor BrkB family protein [Burkholderiales bacterium]|nr:YihY/virulence factor BrkB family protein [Burkholderiales bacterium]
MPPFFEHVLQVIQHPAKFALQVIRAFRANQGLLLAGAVAYYALLSIVPLLILIVIALSHFFEQAELLASLGRALEWVAPGQSKAVLRELADFLQARVAVGWVLLGTMLIFSSLAFTVLENAMSVIFMHRLVERKRHFLVSVLIPFAYILFLGLALLVGTLVQASLESIGAESIVVFGHAWSLGGLSGGLLYAFGVIMEILLIASIYLVMPFGRLSVLHALIGGTVAGLLWEAIRHGLVWYFGHISRVSVVYGSLSSAIVVLLSFEIGATLLLLGAQVIAEYERLSGTAKEKAARP